MNSQRSMIQIPTWHRVHPDFRLNGVHYGFDELQEIGYSLVKEGRPFEVSIGDFLMDWASERPTLDVFTSGSTGNPKRISVKKEHMVNSARATEAYFNLEPGDLALLCLPCTGIAGKMMLVRAMVLGLALDYVEPSSSPIFGAKQYNFVAMVPLQVQKSLNQLDKIKILLIGGAPISHSLRKKLETPSTDIFETYGMTETLTHVAVKSISKGSDYFETLPNVAISKDDRGCLVIQAHDISDTEIITNDIVELIDTQKFTWLGRYDSIINSGGIKLIPEQIEEKLAGLIESRFFVAGVPDAKLGQKLILVVEGEEAMDSTLFEDIKSMGSFDTYEIPKEVHWLKAFTETNTGKIHREKTLLQIP